MASLDRARVESLEALLQDRDLERLEALAEEFNMFEVLRAVTQEVRHSNLLAWLLDPSGNHGLSDYFARLFLWKTTSLAKHEGIGSLSPVDVDALDLTRVLVRREWRGIDILLSIAEQGFVCAIENKVEAAEHGDQLLRYARECSAEFPECVYHFVFLSATGARPSQPEWVSFGYEHIADLVERTLQAKGKSIGDEVALFLRHYVSMLRRHIVRESEIGELCERIYGKHRQALDLLFEYRPDTQAELRRILEELIEEDPAFDLDYCSKVYIKFAPRAWTSTELRRAGSGSSRIVAFMFQNRPDSLTLYLEIQPGDPAVRSRIHEAARNSSIFRAPAKLSPQYSRIFKRDFLRAADYEQPLEWLEDQIKVRMQAFKKNDFPEIDKVIQEIQFA